MIKPIAGTFALAIALAPAAAVSQVSGGYIGAPLPPPLAPHNACGQIIQSAAPIERPRFARIPYRNARRARSCCRTGMCTEGGGL